MYHIYIIYIILNMSNNNDETNINEFIFLEPLTPQNYINICQTQSNINRLFLINNSNSQSENFKNSCKNKRRIYELKDLYTYHPH